MISIKNTTFRKITGIEFVYFVGNAMKGDGWGVFLKLVTMLEASCKRAIGLKIGIDPDLESVGRVEFYAALRLCRDASLIPEEAFAFVNKARMLRNDLAHSGAVLELSIDTIMARVDGPKYLKGLDSFLQIEGCKAADDGTSHSNALLASCVAFVGYLAFSLFGESWLQQTEPKKA